MASKISPPDTGLNVDRAGAWLAVWSGVVFATVWVKLGSPMILSDKTHAPENLLEWLILSWPPRWGYALLGLWLLAAVALAWRLPPSPRHSPAKGWWRWTPWLLLAWLAWQVLAALFTVEPHMTRLVFPHLFACGVCFLGGRFVLARTRHPEFFWGFAALGVVVTLVGGWDQHWGGLEATRRQFEQLPPEMRAAMDTLEFRARMASNRIFSTFFYPNAFAGGLLLGLPATVAFAWRWGAWRNRILATALSIVTALGGLACLVWTGSKAGWLIAVAMGVVLLLLGPWPRSWKLVLAGAVLGLGLVAFGIKYSGYFARGAPSAGARLTYWRVAWQNTREHLLLGSGPGTFAAVYRIKKPPEAEMTRLVHNDYLQQATDSGLPGFLFYALFMAGMLAGTRPRHWHGTWPVAAWLGVLGWALQSLVEFGLYIPALAWPAFMWLGWLRAESLTGQTTS